MSSATFPSTKAEIYINADLAAKATEAGVDMTVVAEVAISPALEKALVTDEDRRLWKEENQAAIEFSNRYVEEHGLPLARYRRYPWPDSTPT